MLQALERQQVTFIVIGALGRVIHGSDELTDGIDVVPATNEQNLRRLALAPDELNARRADGNKVSIEGDLARQDVLELQADAGELKIIPEPVGTRGYGDLRRRANREPLGDGLRPSVASIDDHARMLAALAPPRPRAPPCSSPPHRTRTGTRAWLSGRPSSTPTAYCRRSTDSASPEFRS